MATQATVGRSAAAHHIPAAHRERFALAADPQNQGEKFEPSDYVQLVAATFGLPAVLIMLAVFA